MNGHDHEYGFTLIIEGDVEAAIDGLFEAGCDDATFGAVDRVQYADFDREAPTFARAVSSAISDVESVSGLRVRRVEPDDLVTASEIAERLGRSREGVRLLAAGARGPGDFPPPVSHLRTRSRLWRWSEVADWAGQSTKEERERAGFVAALNAALELRAKAPSVPEESRAVIASLAGSGTPSGSAA